MSVSESQSFDTWPRNVRRWFERKVRVTLDSYRNYQWFQLTIANAEMFDWTVAWFGDHMGDYLEMADLDKVWVSDLRHHNCRIGYDRVLVVEHIQGVAKKAQEAVARNQDAEKYTDLDSWLEALHGGQLAWPGPSEKDGEDLVEGSLWDFRKAARQRRKHWPKRCRVCDEQFRPEPANVKSCSSCLAEIRAERQAKRQARQATT